MASIVKRWLGIQAFKHDGSIHRYWDRAFVVENNEHYLVTAAKKAKVTESNGRKWFTKEPAITIFSKDEWWNVICMFKKDGIHYYCNIASPCIISGENIKYIDYDLDAKLFPSGQINVLDRNEYAHHKERFGYDDDLDKVLNYAAKDVIKRMQTNSFPFNNEQTKDFFDKFLEEVK